MEFLYSRILAYTRYNTVSRMQWFVNSILLVTIQTFNKYRCCYFMFHYGTLSPVPETAVALVGK